MRYGRRRKVPGRLNNSLPLDYTPVFKPSAHPDFGMDKLLAVWCFSDC